MPDLPYDNHNYERVLIHDNYCTLKRLLGNFGSNDEGATSWRSTKKKAEANYYDSIEDAREYIQARNLLRSNPKLTKKLVENLKRESMDHIEGCMWSVDAYDCFDESKALYKWVDNCLFRVPEFFTQEIEEVKILGVEMECSALFASGSDLGIPTAALIIVSRTLDYLLGLSPERRETPIHDAEQKCFEAVLDLLANL